MKILSLVLTIGVLCVSTEAISKRSYLSKEQKIRQNILPKIMRICGNRGVAVGSLPYIRVFKQSRELEVWLKKPDGNYVLYNTFRICGMSGGLGPKQRKGDMQAPEGFYNLTRSSLNPWSRYHLSMNIGYPNAFDRAKKRTGNYIMIHGGYGSRGCLAMSNSIIEEIYTLMSLAFDKGHKKIAVHIFPFPLEEHALKRHTHNKWYNFWRTLQKGYLYFKNHKIIPPVNVIRGCYAVR
jgi:murein L,D-transpeptidase YafK